MKFLCDVHISFKLVKYLNSLGYETIHVNSLPDKWHTKDKDICICADRHDLILVTKDYDFKNSFFINRTPRKLIKITLGNISNDTLIQIILDNLNVVEKLNEGKRFLLEIGTNLFAYTDE